MRKKEGSFVPVLDWRTKKEDVKRGGLAAVCALREIGVYGDAVADNLLIYGDNLLALKALAPHYAGAVKCVCIDPPYNTGNAFKQYDDNLEHSLWLRMMVPRLFLLRDLLADDGSIWITISDDEAHYLKVIMDEIFGRKNFICNFIWEKKRKASFLGRQVGSITDHVLCYGKDKLLCAPFTFGSIGENETYPLYNPGNKRAVLIFPPKSVHFRTLKDGDYGTREYAEKTSVVKLVAPLKIADGWNESELRIEGEWRYAQSAVDGHLGSGEHYVVKSGKFRPRRVLNGKSKGKKIHNLLSRSHYDMATNEDASDEMLNLFGGHVFDYPKPEKLIYFIISAATKPGDLVLDSFLGSGTTAAVAHKMGRRYIGVEVGEHAKTHCIPRMQKVVDGEQGGISESVKWKGGGGFRFCELGGEVFDENGDINPQLDFLSLAAHLWFAVARSPLAAKKKTPFLGEYGGEGYALLYNGIIGDKSANGGNIITAKTLAAIRRAAPRSFAGKVIVYANGCRLGAARMRAENIVFRQIPYECGGTK